ncbi:MAG TPA: TRAP transporter large permease [Egibacteraceae bacterium]|nr:TRAP transporter large permease [Egibacteraceae bacterium]
MSGTEAALLVVALLFVLLITRMPVAFALAAAGAVGIILVRGWDVASTTMATMPFQASSRHALVIVPLFILMGIVAKHCRIVEDVFALASRRLAWLPGGLGVATVAACAAFAAVSGSSIASAAAVGRMAIDEMRKFGYNTAFAAGIVASAGTLGVLIPPSLMLVIYGILTGESIGRLLVAGIVPGLLSATLYAVWIMMRARNNTNMNTGDARARADAASTPALRTLAARAEAAAGSAVVPAGGAGRAPAAVDEGYAAGKGQEVSTPARSSRSQVYGLLRALVLFTVVIGGIYSGIFTATESAAVGACLAIVLLVGFFRRSPALLWAAMRESLKESAALSSMIFAILVGASLFTFFLVSAGLPTGFARWATGFELNATLMLIVLLLCMVPLGMFLDGVSVLVLATPFLYPVASALGIDGIFFGVLMVKMVELALITPPIGLNAYVIASSVPDVTVEDAFRGVMGFAFVDMMTVALLVTFPALVLWLPNLMHGG